MSGRRIRAMAGKEWLQLRRDPRSMGMAFVLPVALLIFFGYAITWDVDEIRLAVEDREGSRQSRELVEAFRASGYFVVHEETRDPGRGEALILTGEVLGVLRIPADFSEDLLAGRPAPVQLLLDGSDANTATIALGYADAIATRFSADLRLDGRAARAAIEPALRVWYNPSLESRAMIVPGLVAVLMMVIAAMLTSLTIAREWERGTMEQLASTPVREWEVVVGKLLPYLIIGFVDVAVTVAAGAVIFQVPFRGSLALLGGLTLLFLVGALGLGIFISATVKSQVPATQYALIGTLLPALLLSGFLFDIASMPPVLQAVTYLVPARYFVTVTRGILLKGVGPGVLWTEAAFMVAFAAAGLGLAVRVFRKELE